MYGGKEMKVMGVDCAFESDNFGISVTVVHGSFKAPHPHDILLKSKSWEMIKT